MTIGKKIKTLRKGRGLTQFQLAHYLDCSRGTIANYETEKRCPSFADIRKIHKDNFLFCALCRNISIKRA